VQSSTWSSLRAINDLVHQVFPPVRSTRPSSTGGEALACGVRRTTCCRMGVGGWEGDHEAYVVSWCGSKRLLQHSSMDDTSLLCVYTAAASAQSHAP
jgi:hypothetical protein